ncbi:MAG: hypothetical protein JNL10_03185 [Verrucomicrobiales bacterium]|nr:hypothetical protein [Verrucomicrobiales bacterium]
MARSFDVRDPEGGSLGATLEGWGWTVNVSDRARRYLSRLPPAVSGSGGHAATFKAACYLVRFGLDRDTAGTLLMEWNAGCQPPWSPRELAHKLNEAFRLEKPDPEFAEIKEVVGPIGPTPTSEFQVRPLARPSVQAVEFSRPHFDRLARRGPELTFPGWRQWLWERSAVRPDCMTPGSFLARLYRPGERVVVLTKCDTSKIPAKIVEIRDAGTDQLTEFTRGHDAGVWFLAQPVDGGWHDDGDGGKSCRNGSAVTAWRYVVLESDTVAPADWLRLLVTLPLRLSAVYTSGGRSVHALVRLDAASKEAWDAQVRPLKPAFKMIGADPGALSAVRLTRLPGCWRGEKGDVQRLLYLNPDPTDVPILDAPMRETREAFLARMRTSHPRWNSDWRAEA